jgi:hypothetical protein
MKYDKCSKNRKQALSLRLSQSVSRQMDITIDYTYHDSLLIAFQKMWENRKELEAFESFPPNCVNNIKIAGTICYVNNQTQGFGAAHHFKFIKWFISNAF